MQYGHPELADSLPELPRGSMTGENDQMSMTNPGKSQQLPLEVLPLNRAETRMEDDQEYLSIVIGPPDESTTNDTFTLSGAETPAQDEPDTGISQINAADIESELNNLLTIDDSGQYPPLVADHSGNLEPVAVTSVPDLPSTQLERRCYPR